MPSKVFILNSIGVILQYSLFGLLYYFLYKVIKLIYTDLNLSEHKKVSVKNVQNKFDGSTEAKLLVVDSGHVNLAQTSFFLEGTVYLGRNENNGIVIEDSFISHEHASIHKNQQGYWLTDLHSTNKTYLNGQPIVEATLLRNGDLIKVGSVTFSFKG
ncbi:FHA domain-containing protein [Pelosinus sp. UFO1]|uniref:FHA domain-containing protein n=1 Tax=Pelosinus sp. UFO1 TaxID=484770 RepID=UPI0004D0EEEF|nr:FHA domain-containing protein [Pelosinus sp. UFO1]AIF51932.1 FHA domain containing protein [Pelosinus sp. UFO1]